MRLSGEKATQATQSGNLGNVARGRTSPPGPLLARFCRAAFPRPRPCANRSAPQKQTSARASSAGIVLHQVNAFCHVPGQTPPATFIDIAERSCCALFSPPLGGVSAIMARGRWIVRLESLKYVSLSRLTALCLRRPRRVASQNVEPAIQDAPGSRTCLLAPAETDFQPEMGRRTIVPTTFRGLRQGACMSVSRLSALVTCFGCACLAGCNSEPGPIEKVAT